VVEERVEHDTDRFAARDDAEDIKSHDEVEGCGAWKAYGEGAEYGEKERGQDFERNFEERVGEEECGKGVCAVFVFVVEDLGWSVEGRSWEVMSVPSSLQDKQ